MARFIAKRTLISILIVFLVSIFAFSLMHILPGDPARLVLGEDATEEALAALRAEWNLDKPLVEQYLIWLGDVFHGDFGRSILYNRPVIDIIGERMPRTVAIGLPALIISAVVGILCGIISAVRRGKLADKFITLFSTLGVGTPAFWVGILTILLFAINLKILPIQGFTSPAEDFGDYVKHAILPVVCLSWGMIASIARQTRSNMLEVINQDYIRTARANGLASWRIILKHALRNALIPVITIAVLQVRVVIGGSLIVEQVFNIAGIGQLLKAAVSNRDYLIVQTCVLLISLITVGCNFVVDILYGVIDPHTRKQRGGNEQ